MLLPTEYREEFDRELEATKDARIEHATTNHGKTLVEHQANPRKVKTWQS